MRLVMTLLLLLASGSVWADVWKVTAKVASGQSDHGYRQRGFYNHPHHDGCEHRSHQSRGKDRKKHGKKNEWPWRRPTWSLFYSNTHAGFGHGQHQVYGRDYHDRHDGHRHAWRTADQFKTRRSNKSEQVVYINAEVSAISLRGIKRQAAIYGAYAELGNGRKVSLRELEGSLYKGHSFTRHFRKPRYIKKLYLRVGPEYRHQRAYVSVDYLALNGH